jgi:ribosomal-protein-alanine N-acetyltransferase
LSERCLEDAWSEAAVGSVLATPGTFGFIALVFDAPQAFILCRAAGGECEVLALGTVRERRRQGMARRLVDLAFARAGVLGAHRMVIEVAEDNSAARDLYARCGFSEVGRRARYYRRPSGEHADALILSRD